MKWLGKQCGEYVSLGIMHVLDTGRQCRSDCCGCRHAYDVGEEKLGGWIFK